MTRLVPMLWLCGCPYVFGPGDFSNVDLDAVTTGATADTALPDLTEVGVAVRSAVDGLEFALQGADPTGVQDVQSVVVLLNTEVRTYTIDDAEVWNPLGTSRFVWAADDPCAPRNVDARVDVLDSLDRPLGLGTTDVAIDGRGVVDDEDTLGVLADGSVFCGEMLNLGDDIDELYVTVPTAGQWRFTLTWQLTGDVDLFMEEEGGNRIGESFGTMDVEEITVDLVPNRTYSLFVYRYQGFVPPLWHVAVEKVS